MSNGTQPKTTIKTIIGKPVWTDETKTVLTQDVTQQFSYADDISILQQFQNQRNRLLHAQADALGAWLLLDILSRDMPRSKENDHHIKNKVEALRSKIIESFKGDVEHLQQFIEETHAGLQGLEEKAIVYEKDVAEWEPFTRPPFDRLRLKRAEAIAKEKEGRGEKTNWKKGKKR